MTSQVLPGAQVEPKRADLPGRGRIEVPWNHRGAADLSVHSQRTSAVSLLVFMFASAMIVLLGARLAYARLLDDAELAAKLD